MIAQIKINKLSNRTPKRQGRGTHSNYVGGYDRYQDTQQRYAPPHRRRQFISQDNDIAYRRLGMNNPQRAW